MAMRVKMVVVIMPPTIGSAMRRMTHDIGAQPVEDEDGQQPGKSSDHRHEHGANSH
uniref:Uncharacterized protein n=1 Tax=Candidatus Kentrum sp. LFY TaxID=2126342 RepID=A0A450UEY9_9GAMM|nr:MAG: hypothetical protein BECKLFY1418A_GA0070994_101431 [Candidatus Kentron sp. LFY]